MRKLSFVIALVFLSAGLVNAQQEVGHYDNITTNTREIDGRENYIFVGDGSIFRSIDVSDPTDPTDADHIDFGYPHGVMSVFIQGDYAYLYVYIQSGYPGLYIIDISNPKELSQAGYQYGQFLEIFVDGDYAYICTMNEFEIWDVSDPDNITQVGPGLTLPSNTPYDIFKDGDYVYVMTMPLFGTRYLSIYDVSDVNSPFVEGLLEGASGSAIWVWGDYCFTTTGSAFRSYDVSDPANPFLAATYTLPDLSRDLHIQGDSAYVVGYETPFGGTPALWCLNISDPLDVFLEWEFIRTGAQVVYVNGDYAYFGCGSLGIYIVDITDGELPDMEIALVPDSPPIIVPPGAHFKYHAGIANNGDEGVCADAWIKVRLPSGSYYPLDVYNDLYFPPEDTTVFRNIRQSVPGFTPPGEYLYIGYVGDYDEGTVYDSSYFDFTVVEGLANGVNGWSLQGWPVATSSDIPSEFSLSSNYPNPFNATTEIGYALPAPTEARIDIYNLLGQRIETLVESRQEAGEHTISWDASSYSSGIYFYKLSTGDKVFTRRMTLLR